MTDDPSLEAQTERDVVAVTALCRRLGAPAAQAETMARQLVKRSDQLARKRGLTREAALEHLLRVLVEGRGGRVPPAAGSAHQAGHGVDVAVDPPVYDKEI